MATHVEHKRLHVRIGHLCIIVEETSIPIQPMFRLAFIIELKYLSRILDEVLLSFMNLASISPLLSVAIT